MQYPKVYLPFLHDHATAIGYLSIYYSALENRANQMLEELTGLDEEETKVMTNQIDLLKKMPAIKALAFMKRPSELWYSDVDLFAWAVTNWIVPKRNRFVHDRWLSLPSGAVRLYARTRIAKTQSSEPETLTTSERIDHDSSVIWELVQDTKDVSNLFRLLASAFKSGRAATEPESTFPHRYREAWLARRKPRQHSAADREI